ncbi:MAG: FAD-dependent oxidoreductase [bacterium]|nr:FAD-dependent oxidoreductase [bacterium]
MRHQTDVVIIGGGSVGICSAHYLLETGRKVTVLEKGEICSGSSYGNAGLIVPSHSVPLAAPGVISKGLRWMLDPESPFYIKPRLNLELASWLWKFHAACAEKQMLRSIPVIRDLNLASLRLFDELASIQDLDFGYQKKGHLAVYRTPEGLAGGVEEAHLLSQNGVQTEVLTPEELQKLDPAVHYNTIGAVYFPQDAHLIPDRFVKELAQHAQSRGADLRPNTEVLGFETTSGRIHTIQTTRGEFTANQIILASGSWSPGVVKTLGLNLPIQPAKGYSITFKRPPICPTIPASLAESKVAVTPMGDNLRFAGTLELAGLDLSINNRRVRAILNAVPRYLPALDPNSLEQLEIWRGLRPCTPDGLPFLGRSEAFENLIVAAGHAMIGISLGPITGKLVSQLVARKPPQIDLAPLCIERFA